MFLYICCSIVSGLAKGGPWPEANAILGGLGTEKVWNPCAEEGVISHAARCAYRSEYGSCWVPPPPAQNRDVCRISTTDQTEVALQKIRQYPI